MGLVSIAALNSSAVLYNNRVRWLNLMPQFSMNFSFEFLWIIKYIHRLNIYIYIYCTWFDTNPQSDLVTTNTVIIYIYMYIYIYIYIYIQSEREGGRERKRESRYWWIWQDDKNKWKVDKSNTYNGFSSNISFFIQGRTSWINIF